MLQLLAKFFEMMLKFRNENILFRYKPILVTLIIEETAGESCWLAETIIPTKTFYQYQYEPFPKKPPRILIIEEHTLHVADQV
jgi:hypothetical protein